MITNREKAEVAVAAMMMGPGRWATRRPNEREKVLIRARAVLDAIGFDELVITATINSQRLSALLAMTDPPPSIPQIAHLARRMLAEERTLRLAAEIELDETKAALDRAIALACHFESESEMILAFGAGDIHEYTNIADDLRHQGGTQP